MAFRVSLSPFWDEMTQAEREKHFDEIGQRILEHRYRYYVQDHPVLDDQEYDWLERYYELMATTLGVHNADSDMVGFDAAKPRCCEAAVRVQAGTDYYSLWVTEMQPIWDRCGRPKWTYRQETLLLTTPLAIMLDK